MAYHKFCHLFLTFVTLSCAQRLFIDSIPAYSELPVCAVDQLRTVVKNMENGCGDGKHTTSYSCFCTDSSSYFSGVISTKVASACLPETTTAVQAAADVFSSYCALGSNGTSVNSTAPSAATSRSTATHSSITSTGTNASRASLPSLPTETGSSRTERLRQPEMYYVVLTSQLAALLLQKL